jgi:hypothetical protein
VTSGTPEGSINSPELFNLVYRVVLGKLGIEELPTDYNEIDPHKVYYVVFADDLTFVSLNLRRLEQVANDFKREGAAFDLEVNAGKTKWMMFVPPDPKQSTGLCNPLELRLDNEVIENVDTFVYLGFELDCHLDDKAHIKRVSDRLMKAARATGQILRNMKCASLISLRKYFLTLVNSHLYGTLFVDVDLLDWARAVGVFIRSAFALPHSFPSSICVAILGLRSIRSKVTEERMRFMLRIEGKRGSPLFAALVHDRCFLMPLGYGLNDQFGKVLSSLDILCTLDYRPHYSKILQAVEAADMSGRNQALLGTGGRAFWTEVSSTGWLPIGLVSILSKLPTEEVRSFLLFLADSLRWTAFMSPNPCPFCAKEYLSSHFFCCASAPFLTGREWDTFIALCRNEAWQDVVEVWFAVMKRWTTTSVFKPQFTLSILEFVPEPDVNPFRLSIF